LRTFELEKRSEQYLGDDRGTDSSFSFLWKIFEKLIGAAEGLMFVNKVRETGLEV